MVGRSRRQRRLFGFSKIFPGTTFNSQVSGFQKGVAAMAPQQKQNMSPDIELNLALAVVASSAAPLLLLDGDLTLLAVSDFSAAPLRSIRAACPAGLCANLDRVNGTSRNSIRC